MGNTGEERRFDRALLFKICLMTVVLGGLLALFVWVSVQKPSQPSFIETSSTPTRTVVEDDNVLEKVEGASEATRPKDDQIWDFETAYVTPDPVKQLELLEKIATPQYIANEYSANSIDVDKLVVRVDRRTSSFSIVKGSQNTYCLITSKLNLTSFRDEKLVLSYSIQHTTMWINTHDGWKVASEMR